MKKKYWEKIIWFIGIIGLPFFIEWLLFVTPVVSKFSNETWFAFMGSYIGAITTLIVMHMTFRKSEEENRRILKRQKEQHDLEKHIDKVQRIVRTLLLDDYYFLNSDTVGERMHKFMGDFQYIQFDTIYFGFVTHKDEKLMNELVELQTEEAKIVNRLKDKISNIDSRELEKTLVSMGLELSKVANSRREIIIEMFDSYSKRAYEEYYKGSDIK